MSTTTSVYDQRWTTRNPSYPRGRGPAIVRDTGEVVVYQYPTEETAHNDNEYHIPYDFEDIPDDGSLAAKDALALGRGDAFLDPGKPRPIEDALRRRRRIVLLLIALSLLLGIVVVTSVMKPSTESSQKNVGEGVANAEGELGTVPTDAPGTAATPSPTFTTTPGPDGPSSSTWNPGTGAPSAVVVVTQPPQQPTYPPTESPTSMPTRMPTYVPTESPTGSFAAQVLQQVAYDPNLLYNPRTSEGQAFAIVTKENLGNPTEIIQRYSLLAFYFAANGDDWVLNEGWKSQAPDTCSWQGMNCQNGVVKGISLSNNNLMGTLPNDICLLTSMESFITSANTLVGQFPSCFGRMSNLKEIHVNANFFTGSLPQGLHNLQDLMRLTLSFNNFNGDLGALFNGARSEGPVFPKLQTLDLHTNGLKGLIPDDSLAGLTNLKALTLDNNPGLFGSMTTTCSAGNVYLASADCNKVNCPCCTRGNNCLT